MIKSVVIIVAVSVIFIFISLASLTGSLYDEKGNFRVWWTSESYSNFKKRSRCMAEQYSNITVFGRKVCI